MTPLRRHPNLRKRLPRLLLAALLACAWTLPATAQDEAPVERLRSLAASDRDAALARLNERLATPAGDTDAARLERARMLEIRGRLLRDRSRYDDAQADAEAMLALAEALDRTVLQGRAIHLLGTLEAERGRFVEALRTFQRADALLADTGAQGVQSRVKIALGNTHLFTGNAARAAAYFEEARTLAAQADDTSREITALSNKAIALADTQSPEASLAAHREALALARDAGQPLGLHNVNICDRLIELGRLREAEPHCRDALDQLDRTGAQRHLAGARMTMGDLMLARNRPRDALAFFESAHELAAGRIPSVERELHRSMAAAHRRLGEFEDAADHLEALLALRDELDERERGDLLEQLELRYQVRQAEQEVELLSLQTQLQKAQLQRRNLLLAVSAVSLLLVSMLAIVAWRGYRKQKTLKAELADRNAELESAVRKIGRMARRDALTGLLTRNVFLAAARKEIARVQRSGEGATVVMADIDNFKRINDEHGHAVGDEVLVDVARRLRDDLRDMDYVCRWGGEEFVALLPETSTNDAVETMERLRTEFERRPIATASGDFRVTLTFGVAPLGDDIDDSINAADRAMYAGKRAGRNRVEQTGDGPTDADCRSD